MRHLLVTLLVGLSMTFVGCSKKSSSKKEKKKDETTQPTDNTTSANARPRLRRRRPIDHGARAKRLQKRFNLDDDQAAKLEDMFKTTPRREQRAKMKEIFTDDQWKNMQDMRRNSMGRRFGLNPERRANFMKASFGLDDDQTKKVVEILKTTPRGAQQDAIKKLLTADQLKRWEQLRRGRGKIRRMPNGKLRFAPKAPAPAKKDLGK